MKALDAAVPLFWRHGYEGTSVAELAKAMGAAPPTLYAAFGSKEDLYREVLDRYVERYARLGANPQASTASAFDIVSEYLRDAARDFADRTRPPGCMVSTGSLQSAPANAACGSATAKMRSTATLGLRKCFQRAVEMGELPGGTDIEALAAFYTAIVHGMSVQSCDDATAEVLAGAVDLALRAWPGNTAQACR